MGKEEEGGVLLNPMAYGGCCPKVDCSSSGMGTDGLTPLLSFELAMKVSPCEIINRVD